MIQKNRYLADIISVFLIAAAVMLAYANSLQGPFLFDDYHNIIGNEHVKISKISFESLKEAAIEGPSKFRWIPKISFALNYFFAEKSSAGFHGGAGISGHGFVEPSPVGYHLVNLLVHLAAAVCLFFLFRLTLAAKTLGKETKHDSEIALVATLLWALHPLQTNGVAYIVQRMTGMASLFFVASLLFYVLGRRQGRGLASVVFFVLSLASGLLAVFSKENAAILPLMILGYELYFLEGIQFSKHGKKIIILLATSGLMVIGLGWLYLGRNPFTSLLGGYATRDFTMLERLLTQPRVIGHYLSLLVLPLPSRLNLAYDFPVSTALFSPAQTFPALLVLAIMAFFAVFLFKRNRLLSFGLFWLLVNLAIESSFIPLEIIFEHRMYLPSVFLFLSLVSLCYRTGLEKKYIVRVMCAVLVCLLAFFTWQRNQTWASRENVWADVALKSPNLTRGHMGLYVAYKAQGREAEAVEALKKAIEVGPDEFRPSYNLANFYNDKKQYKQALMVLNNMMQRPNLRTAPAYHLRASIYLELKNYNLAIGDAKSALEVDPNHTNSLVVLGSAYFRVNNFSEAARYFERARNLLPDSYGVHFNLGTTYYNLGDYDKAIMNYRQALEYAPNNADIHYNLGMVYGAKGMVREMQEHLAISRRLKGR